MFMKAPIRLLHSRLNFTTNNFCIETYKDEKENLIMGFKISLGLSDLDSYSSRCTVGGNLP